MRTRNVWIVGIVFLLHFAAAVGASQITSETNARLETALREHPEAAAISAAEKTGDGLWVASTGHSLVGPALGPFETIAKAAGHDGHRQIRQLSGGATGSPRAHWEKPEDKQIMKPALETGKWDVLTMGAHYEGSEIDDFDRWIELGLKHNPEMVFYIQDAWPRLPDLLEGGGRDAEGARVTLDRYEARMKEFNDSIGAKVEALNKRHPGKVHVIPVALYRDAIHPSSIVATLEGYLYYACVYGKNPMDVPGHVFEDTAIDHVLREVAWQVVTEHPHTGVK